MLRSLARICEAIITERHCGFWGAPAGNVQSRAGVYTVTLQPPPQRGVKGFLTELRQGHAQQNPVVYFVRHHEPYDIAAQQFVEVGGT